ncbi:WD40 repeat-like protein [Exidia glandulosa HHB12029]|uniref:WD40 repeat-like protein n=1 Tax=Exidia glandulosa HHB12029 TaxID=1314781 RepID=A0A165CE31_EXIGL|nr:WD40 repeat-like protein [Exidia glandulosa HHB12029]
MQRYAELWTTTKHASPVSFVAFSGSGELLATGDDAGHVYIWSISSGKLFQSLAKCSAEAVSCCWSDDKEIFVGTAIGELHFFEHDQTQNRFERSVKLLVNNGRLHIPAIVVQGNRVACCSGNTIHCYRMDDSGLQRIFSWSMHGVRELRTVHFVDRQTIMATAIHEGECALIDVREPAYPLWRRTLRHRIGESALSTNGQYFAVTTLASSVRVYEVGATGLKLVREVQAPNRVASNFPLQICFAESQSMIISGSDRGEIRLWEVTTGNAVVLRHSGPTAENELQLLQAVAAHTTAAGDFIASACNDGARSTVKVWKRQAQGLTSAEVGGVTFICILFLALVGGFIRSGEHSGVAIGTQVSVVSDLWAHYMGRRDTLRSEREAAAVHDKRQGSVNSASPSDTRITASAAASTLQDLYAKNGLGKVNEKQREAEECR